VDDVLEIVWLARKWSFGVVNFVFIVKGQSCRGRLEDVDVLCWHSNEYVSNKLYCFEWWDDGMVTVSLANCRDVQMKGFEELEGCGMNWLLPDWGMYWLLTGGFEELEGCGMNWLLPDWGMYWLLTGGFEELEGCGNKRPLSLWGIIHVFTWWDWRTPRSALGQHVSWPIFEPRNSWLRRVNTPLDRDLMSTGRNQNGSYKNMGCRW